MNLKERLKNYALWFSIFTYIPVVCEAFKWDVIPDNYEGLVVGLLSIFVLAGFINDPKSGKWFGDKEEVEETKEFE